MRRLRELLELLLYLLSAVARQIGPGRAEALVAGNPLIEQQRLALARSRRRVANLAPRGAQNSD